ncbi:hypothetical protein SAMN04487904_105217 [Actinopolyspora lacussalsi subsp. righensis]|uniref:Uncharacterized protein n=1 Tax=Actinopolyspora righensis TaxID=995060 RepID=A0A1I6ZV72_9ACTN|nr:hypothetical protein SAMN04487904_105217 [Actinopolyspora righensis]
MNIILARLNENHPPMVRSVHIFAPDKSTRPDGIRKAYCGFITHYSNLESTEAFAGMPCELCLRSAPVEPAETAPTRLPETADRERKPGIDLSGPAYAASLSDDRIWHDVSADLLISGYRDGHAAQTVCGFLGWFTPGTPPSNWQHCPECEWMGSHIRKHDF